MQPLSIGVFSTEIFNSVEEEDIPFSGFSDSEIVFSLIGEGRGEVGKKKKAREEVKRWHPDKFYQKVGHRIIGGSEKRVMERVNRIVQVLNMVAKEE